MGVVFAGDLLTLIVFWEAMAVASTALVLAGDTPGARRAGMRYLFVHVVGGSVLLAGVLWHLADGSGLAFDAFEGTTAAWLMLGGAAVNAAVVPLHAWLPDAYPRASVTGAVFLGGFTTKTAVYVLARGFPHWEILIWLGLAMAVVGVLYALVQNDVRRVLAYDIVSQVGLMVAAVGIGTEAAVSAAAAHAFAHVLYNALLFMAAGALVYAAGSGKLTELGGMGRSLWPVFGLFVVGALALAAAPGIGAFSTKALLAYAAEMKHNYAVVFVLYAVSAGTFAAAALRVPYLLLRGPAQEPMRQPPAGMYAAGGAAAVLCVVIGAFPHLLYGALPAEIDFTPYTAGDLVRTFQLLGLAGVGFWLVKGRLGAVEGQVLDVDWLYRKAAAPVRVLLQEPLERALSAAERASGAAAAYAGRLAVSPDDAWSGALGARAGAAIALLGRPPLAVAVGAVLLTFGVVLVLALAG